MLKIYDLLGDISCLEIVATIIPTRRIERIEGWIGAHIRNMLLAATNEVECDEADCSLMDKINHFPLNDQNHHWYKELKGGFPKGYLLKILSQTQKGYQQTIEQGKKIQFSITLIGSLAEYAPKMIAALEIFAYRGIHCKMELEINAIKKYSLLEDVNQKHNNNNLLIDFITPISLLNNPKRKQQEQHNQIGLNGFIPLSQLVVSAINRVAKMAVLYGNCKATAEELSEASKEITQVANKVILKRCNLYHTVLTTSKRRATKDTMVFDGLVGQTEWYGDVAQLYPLLKFCSHISLGDNVVYGMGDFKVE